MPPEYRTFLAASILSDDRVVTYRLLSRALKVSVNKAKEMLYDFHRQQNGKKPGSVHATYIVAGKKPRAEPVSSSLNDGHIQSSPPFRSSPILHEEDAPEDILRLTICLVKEENLEKLRSEFESITCIHVYSLGPNAVKDLQLLSDATSEVRKLDTDRDPLTYAETYGSIGNSKVRRRDVRTTRYTTAATNDLLKPTPTTRVVDVKTEVRTPTASESSIIPEPTPSQSAAVKAIPSKNAAEKSENKPSTNPGSLKRESSSIFKSFAKAKPKLKRDESGSVTSTSGIESTAAPSGLEDQVMKDASDDDEDDYIVPASTNIVDNDRKSRKAREDALKKMMEDDEEENTSTLPSPHKEEEVAEEPSLVQDEAAGSAETVETSNGRRRGRRRVMKKKTVKDEEGYLVTKEEPAWESFSEDEPILTNSKLPNSSFSSNSGGKVKKPATKGQGSIMSFFGKK